MKIETNLDKYQSAVDTALIQIADANVVERIWEHDHSVWKPDPDEISNRLGWLHTPEDMQANIQEIQGLVQVVRDDGYTNVLLLGMGGSSLAPEVFSKSFGAAEGFLQLDVLDSTDPGAVQSYADKLDLSKTLFIVATKSGGTVETFSFFKYFYNQILAAVGEEDVGQHFVAVTDPGSKLVDVGEQYKFRHIFKNDPNIGGRYSALSYFGMVPAALLGVDIALLLEQAREMAAQCQQQIIENPGAQLGAILAELAKAGRDKLTFLTSPAISSFGDWVEQLIAESTGKEGKGILPIAGEKIGASEVYADDRVFVVLELNGEHIDTDDLEKAGHPVIRISLENIYEFGGQFFLWEFATAVAGHGLGIQPFDQPNVESAKVLAREMVAAYQSEGKLPEGDTTNASPEDFSNFLKQAKNGDYFSIQAYVTPNAETTRALDALRLKLRDKYKLATTVGYGPRFLHSTGQLHKGDGGIGLFIQFVSSTRNDIDIPNEAGQDASNMTFGVLKQAQALGDAAALQAANRRVLSMSVEADPISQINHLAETLI
ncbi:MAG: glucose-6-phosphate isomerase [Chloroflexi bacterium]|nr:MAG: glucose-6-phosphate isomerase [Chloroflexota bacterium]MBL1193743.1 glucose-6-phosphate isomerase [Chloroflexota bacterium]NOH11036.1 glucose-6-phosphate isomerase [Chloroflexota bacterium]